jgi:hypothetical protein
MKRKIIVFYSYSCSDCDFYTLEKRRLDDHRLIHSGTIIMHSGTIIRKNVTIFIWLFVSNYTLSLDKTYRITSILKVETDIITNISVNSIGRVCDNICRGLQNWRYRFYRWCHNVLYVRLSDKLMHLLWTDLIFLWIKVSSVIQTLSAAHIKGKLSNLSINNGIMLIIGKKTTITFLRRD